MKRSAPVLTLLVLWLVLLGGNYALYIVAFPVRVVHHAVISVVLLLWIMRRGLGNSPLTLPLAGMVSAALISAINSPDVRMALENTWFWLNHALLYLLFEDMAKQGKGEALVNGHFIAGALIAAAGLAQYALGSERPASLLMIINLTGSYSGAVAVLAAGWYYADRHKPALLILALALAAMTIANGSRGGLLALGAGVGAFVVLQRVLNRRVLLALGVVGALGGAVTLARFGSDVQRLDVWRSAISMFAGDPLTGVGPGLFAQSYRGIGQMPTDWIGGAHNMALNLAAELGLPGVVSGALIVGTFGYNVIRRGSPRQNAALAALIGITANGAFDSQQATTYAALAMTCAALVVAGNSPARRRVDRLVRTAAGGALALWAVGLVVADGAQYFYEQSILTNDAHAARIAAQLDPAMRLYRLQVEYLENPPVRMMRMAVGQFSNPTQYAMTNYVRFWR